MKELYFYLLYFGLVGFIGFTDLFWDDHIRFILLTAILVMYNFIELVWLYKKNKKYFFINPILLAIVANFLAYNGGISNFLLIKDGIYTLDPFAKPLIEERYWLNYTMAYTCYAAFFMWFGFKLTIGRKISEFFLTGLQYKKFLGSNIRLGLILILVVIGYVIKLYLIEIGLFGRIIDRSVSVSGKEVSFLYAQTRFLRSFSTLPFMFLALMYYRYRTQKLRVIFTIVLILELFFATIHGARSPIIVLSILIFLSNYFNTQKIKLSILFYMGVSLILAFTIILQYKDFVLLEKPIGQSPLELIQNFMEYRSKASDEENEIVYDVLMFNFATRVNFVDEAAMAIRYKEVEGLQKGDPDFVKPLLTIPIDVFVPKFIQGTPSVSWGLWFKNKVYKLNPELFYNVAFSSLGYLYLAGGPLLIFFGFTCYGIILKSAYQFLNYGILGFLVYLLMISIMAVYKTGVAGVYVSYIRFILITPLVLGLIFKKIR